MEKLQQHPLTRMLKKNNFTWTVGHEKVFKDLKQAMVQAPVLALPDFSKELMVKCDASGGGHWSRPSSRVTHSFFRPSFARELIITINL